MQIKFGKIDKIAMQVCFWAVMVSILIATTYWLMWISSNYKINVSIIKASESNLKYEKIYYLYTGDGETTNDFYVMNIKDRGVTFDKVEKESHGGFAGWGNKIINSKTYHISYTRNVTIVNGEKVNENEK